MKGYKLSFEDQVNKIKHKGQEYIDSTRNSVRLSTQLNNNNTQQQQQVTLLNGREYLESIEDKEKQIDIIMKVTSQINEISKQTAELVVNDGEKINSIEDNVNVMQFNIENAVKHMKAAKDANTSSSGYTNYLLYGVCGIVILLILLTIIMPSS
jgi:t-SNARE complex subunit (syntaxin)